MSDPLIIAGREFRSRLFLGTAGYPNRKIMLDVVRRERQRDGHGVDPAHQPRR